MTVNSKGFSLIELLLALMVMGLLGSLVMPNFGVVHDAAKTQVLKSIGHTSQMSLETYFLLNGAYPKTSQDNSAFFSTLKTAGVLKQLPKNPFTGAVYSTTETSGKVSYQYTASTQSYVLTIYGSENKSGVVVLSSN